MPQPFFVQLEEIFSRPQPFCHYSGEELWNDPHVAQQVLTLHLQADGEQISRRHDFISRSAQWIVEYFQLNQGKTVMDFGCGPGLYTEVFAQSGAQVTGLDISTPAIEYAQQQAQKKQLSIEYIRQNYLDYHPQKKYDLLCLIYCDYCALSPEQRKLLLQCFYESMNENASLIFDVYSLNSLAQRQENAACARNLMNGFWSPEDYFGFVNTFIYSDQNLAVDKYSLIGTQNSREVYHWLQYFTPESIESELVESGFEIVTLFEDMCGQSYKGEGSSFAIQAQKRMV